MSASNWRQCPKCLKKKADAAAARIAKAKELYGKVPQEDYDANMRLAVAEQTTMVEEDSLREDYQVFVDKNGNFGVGYSASCNAEGCSFSFRFKHEEKIKL